MSFSVDLAIDELELNFGLRDSSHYPERMFNQTARADSIVNSAFEFDSFSVDSAVSFRCRSEV